MVVPVFGSTENPCTSEFSSARYAKRVTDFAGVGDGVGSGVGDGVGADAGVGLFPGTIGLPAGCPADEDMPVQPRVNMVMKRRIENIPMVIRRDIVIPLGKGNSGWRGERPIGLSLLGVGCMRPDAQRSYAASVLWKDALDLRKQGLDGDNGKKIYDRQPQITICSSSGRTL
jgi:hypothetical protein